MKRRRVLKNLLRKARRFKTPIGMQTTKKVPIIPRMMMTRKTRMMIMTERMMMKTKMSATMMTERKRKTMMKMPEYKL